MAITHFVETRKGDKKISSESHYFKKPMALWPFTPMNSKAYGGAGSIRRVKNGLKGNSEVLGDERTDRGC